MKRMHLDQATLHPMHWPACQTLGEHGCSHKDWVGRLVGPAGKPPAGRAQAGKGASHRKVSGGAPLCGEKEDRHEELGGSPEAVLKVSSPPHHRCFSGCLSSWRACAVTMQARVSGFMVTSLEAPWGQSAQDCEVPGRTCSGSFLTNSSQAPPNLPVDSASASIDEALRRLT